MDCADDERIGLKILLRELDAEPMRMVHPSMPEFVTASIGRLFLDWNRQVNRDVAAGAIPPSPSRDMRRFDVVLGFWTVRVDTFLSQYQFELVEILDWLLLAVGARHQWIENVDENGRPKKLMKCRTVEALYNESVKCMRGRQPARISEHDLTDEDERHVADLDLGYCVIELLSPKALDVESERMRHCVGNGTYDEKLGAPGYHVYSVRDGDGRPHATVELNSKLVDGQFTRVIRQFRGPRNVHPDSHIVELFNSAIDDILVDAASAAFYAPSLPIGRF